MFVSKVVMPLQSQSVLIKQTLRQAQASVAALEAVRVSVRMGCKSSPGLCFRLGFSGTDVDWHLGALFPTLVMMCLLASFTLNPLVTRAHPYELCQQKTVRTVMWYNCDFVCLVVISVI